MWEIFNPRDGRVIRRVPFAWIARLLTRRGSLDYARVGDGWLDRQDRGLAVPVQ